MKAKDAEISKVQNGYIVEIDCKETFVFEQLKQVFEFLSLRFEGVSSDEAPLE